MARGSSKSGGGAGAASGAVEMLAQSGTVANTGKTRLRKKYFVTNEADLTKVPQVAGFRPVDISFNRIGPSAFEQDVEYAAQLDSSVGGLGSVVETLGGVDGTFEMFCNYESHPIELHPRIDKLSVEYGGYFTPDGFAKWPPFYTPEGGGGLGAGAQKRNPLFGVTRYKEISMRFRHTYYRNNIDRSIYDKAGDIVERLPAGFPTPKGPKDKEGKEIRRRFLMLMPEISREGNAYRVVQEYVLLDTSGIADDLYEVTTTPGSLG
jgi:hypothetical protein